MIFGEKLSASAPFSFTQIPLCDCWQCSLAGLCSVNLDLFQAIVPSVDLISFTTENAPPNSAKLLLYEKLALDHTDEKPLIGQMKALTGDLWFSEAAKL